MQHVGGGHTITKGGVGDVLEMTVFGSLPVGGRSFLAFPVQGKSQPGPIVSSAPDTFNSLGHVMRAILSV